MSRILWILIVLAFVVGLTPISNAPVAARVEAGQDQDICNQQGGTFAMDSDGSTICYWIPARWNRDLVVFAHGYVDPRMEVGIPWDQLMLPDGISLPRTINLLRFAFAVTSYKKNGLAVTEGIQAVTNLVSLFKEAQPNTRRIFLVGASEGGLVTTLALEQDAQQPAPVFSGGMSTCGPVGDFNAQVNYWGDFRLIYDHYFPGVIPIPPDVSNPVIHIDPAVIADWSTPQPQPLPALPGPLQDAVSQALTDNPEAAADLIAVTQAAVDPANLDVTTEETTLGLLGYNVTSTNEGRQELSGDPDVDLYTNLGTPYSNVGREFFDPDGTPIEVTTYTPDPTALDEINQSYTTSGYIGVPLVDLHNLGDPIVPFWHESIYRSKTLQAGTGWRFINIPIDRYGHCNFKASEAIFGFVIMVIRATGNFSILGEVNAALPDAVSRLEFQALLEANPGLLNAKILMPLIQR